MHDGQLTVSAPTVRALVAEQFPQWSALPVRALTTAATVNAVFRVGDGLTARLPLLGDDPVRVREVLRAEAEASIELAAVSPLPAPVPVALGEPGRGYPLPWSVQTWLPGHDATVEDPAPSLGAADDLVTLLRALRSAPVGGRTFAGTGRGGSLPDHDAWVRECLQRSAGLLDVPALHALWQELRDLPVVDDDVLTHGDLTPPNVLVRHGRLTGVLDTGGAGAADPALDLVGAWHLLDAPARQRVREALDCGEVQWRRGAAWALEQALGLVWYYATSNPVMSRYGRRTLDRLLAADEV